MWRRRRRRRRRRPGSGSPFRHNPHTFPRFHFHVFYSRRMNLAMTVFAYRRQIRRMVFMNMPDKIVSIRVLLML
jgi:hypothetical protein